MWSSRRMISSVWPLWKQRDHIAARNSTQVAMHRLAGMQVNALRAVEASVPDIFWAMIPALPMPVRTTCPGTGREG